MLLEGNHANRATMILPLLFLTAGVMVMKTRRPDGHPRPHGQHREEEEFFCRCMEAKNSHYEHHY